MRQPVKPFIVEKKQTRRPKANTSKPSIWGNIDLSKVREQDEGDSPSQGPAPVIGMKPETDR